MHHIEDIRRYCLQKPGVSESLPFGDDTLVFKVGSKMFLATSLNWEHLSINLKCEPELAAQLREQYTQVQPGYHMNKKHWNTVIVDGSISSQNICQWIDHSYELVFNGLTKKEKEAIN